MYFFLAFLLLKGSYSLGVAIGESCKAKYGTEGKLASFLTWSNTVSWVFPVAGLLTSGAAGALSTSEKVNKAAVLSLIGLVLSLLNGAAAVLMLLAH